MTDRQSELVAASRLLVQWGRGRQTEWHDASRDLLAALGNRHATFSDFGDQYPEASGLATSAVESPLTVVTSPPAVASWNEAPAPTFEQAPAVTSATPTPLPAEPATAVGAAAPLVTTPPVPQPSARIARTPTSTKTVTRRRFGLVHVALAATVVVAALAAPSVWRTYKTQATVAPLKSPVAINSKPPGSVVIVDGVERGKTPLVTELSAGIYRVELRHRKNVRAFDLEVVAGMPAEATVDWTKKPVIKKKASPEKPAETKTAAAPLEPTATAKHELASDASAAPTSPAAAPSETTTTERTTSIPEAADAEPSR